MNQHTRAEEPSMDDILASIRKIIAEDGVKTGPAPAPVPSAAAEPAPLSSIEPTPAPAAPASLSSKLSDAFGYVPGADPARPASAPMRARAPLKTAIDDDLADIFSDRPLPTESPPIATVAEPTATKSANSGTDVPEAKSLAEPAAPAAAVKPVQIPPPPAASEPTVASPVAPSAPKAAPIVIAAAPRVRPSVEPSSPPRSTAAAPPPALSSLAGLAIPPTAQAAMASSKPAASSPVVLAAMPSNSKDKRPAAPFPTTRETGATPTDEVAPPSTKSIEPGPDTIESPAPSVTGTLGGLDAVLAAVNRQPAPEIIVSAVDVLPASATITTPEKPAAGALNTQLPTVPPPGPAAPTDSVFSKPSAFIGGIPLTPVKTLDDSAAELLRPMLREWLDANMPRIVEKALKIEIAESRQALPRPADGTVKPDEKA